MPLPLPLPHYTCTTPKPAPQPPQQQHSWFGTYHRDQHPCTFAIPKFHNIANAHALSPFLKKKRLHVPWGLCCGTKTSTCNFWESRHVYSHHFVVLFSSLELGSMRLSNFISTMYIKLRYVGHEREWGYNVFMQLVFEAWVRNSVVSSPRDYSFYASVLVLPTNNGKGYIVVEN